MGVTTDEQELENVKFYCEQCRPEQYTELLAAMARGEKPWEKKKKGKARKSKGGRQSRVGEIAPEGTEGPASSSPKPASQTPARDTSNKRKHDAVGGTNGDAEVRPCLSALGYATDRYVQLNQSASKDATPAEKRRKSSHSANKRREADAEVQEPAATLSMDDIPKERQSIAKAILKHFADHIQKVAKAGSYRVPDEHTPTSLGTQLALQLEQALTAAYGGPSNYGDQFRSLRFNLGKNPSLIDRLLSGALKPEQLATMSSTDMASEELQKRMAAMKQEVEKQSVLVSEDGPGPRIRKTHKGDEIVEDDSTRPSDDFVAPVRHRPPPEEDGENRTGAGSPPPGSPHMVELPENVGTRRPLAVDTGAPAPLRERQSSSNFDIKQVWSSVQSPDNTEQRLLQRPPRRRSSAINQALTTGAQDDPDIDRLLKDEDNDVVMDDLRSTGPAFTTPWEGLINMNGLGQFKGIAQYIAGGEVGIKVPYKELLSPTLEITGRIAIRTASDYVIGMRYSSTNDVCVLSATPANSEHNTEQFNNIWNYFNTKARWGVVDVGSPPQRPSPHHESVKDVYIIPIEAGMAPLPDLLNQLDDVRIETPRPENLLLVIVVARTKTPAPSADATPVQHQAPNGAVQTPQPAQPQPQFSPVVNSGNNNNNNGSSFPPSPYSAPPTQPQAPQAQAQSAYPPQQTGTPTGGPPHAQRILGPFINAPVVQTMIAAVPDMSEQQLENLRDILEKVPECRTDIQRLSMHLTERTKGDGVVGAG